MAVLSSRRIEFLYDGADMVGEYNSSGALARRYVHGPGLDAPLVWYEGSGTSSRRWLHADARGSIVAVTGTNGAALETVQYDPYGVPSSYGGSRFLYTGQMSLPEAELYHYKARTYAPSLGRFLQADPIGYAGGMNLYAYVGGEYFNYSSGLAGVAAERSAISHSGGGGGGTIITQTKATDQNICSKGSYCWTDMYNFYAYTPGKLSGYWHSGRGGNIVIDSTQQAWAHYNNGNGETATLGPNTRNAIRNSSDQLERLERITSGQTPSLTGNYGIDITSVHFYVGKTNIYYKTTCGTNMCSTTFTNQYDGFWDPLSLQVVDWGEDGLGPNLELSGGHPFAFEAWSWTVYHPNPYR
ncbi:hypothetical protein CRD36_13970 [Paremcibacter congregatus]|uniref:RHS repeat-associated core domain-containing protein n=3 Tax=Paremcibacter congregatus TaxID=2043170 RepID=A0A2G4YNZ4_9PROT|nr:hypothetical protein CRD36_13970 [Paremcibacter congregatus]QDE29340.1 RHS repeat-associated core domain-containing protein [Paremcibacter congregatus]